MTTIHANITDPEIHEPKGIQFADEDQVYTADGLGSGEWSNLPEVNADIIKAPVGTIANYAGASAPTGWFFCYGQTISRTTYSDLFTKIGTTFGAGDGSTTFTLPDLRGRAVAGKDNMGGTSANRLTNQSGGVNGDIMGAVGGQERVTLVDANVPELTGTTSSSGSHTHSVTNGSSLIQYGSGSGRLSPDDDFNFGVYDGFTIGISSAGAHSHTVTVNSSGDDPHNNMQPTIIMNKMIFHGVF
jgi:microcystin-dependent protein